MNYGKIMIRWMKDLWEYPRSITGHGTYKTLKYIQKMIPELKIHSFKSGDNVFDWKIPLEWNIYDAYIEHESGKRYAELSSNNLHIMGYSSPCNKHVSLEELLDHISTQPDQPNTIPYVTSYYEDRWGFCMPENDKKKMPKGRYRVFIDSKKEKGMMNLADVEIKGVSNTEVFFSTYVCHPSMANNELSGPVLSTALIKYIKENYTNTRLSYRFVFVPETIGSIAYLSKNLEQLQNRVICGFVLSCVGDNRSYSHQESRDGNNVADLALKSALIGLNNVNTYSFLDRGSDERQYCSVGVDLPVCTFSRSRFAKYKEYHTSDDNFDVVNEDGLNGSFNVMKSIIDALEFGLYPKTLKKCEPQLGKYGLYPTKSQKGTKSPDVWIRRDILAYADGKCNIFELSIKIKRNIKVVLSELKILKENNLVELLDQDQH